jgi:hypothetical protein
MIRMHRILCALAFMFAAFLPTLSQCQDAKRLFHRMQIALGGGDKIAAVRDFEECVHADTWNDAGKSHGVVYKRTRWIKPAVLRLDQIGPGDTYVLFFSGASGWEILPDRGFAELTGDELMFARRYANGVDLKLWLADRDSNNLFAISRDDVISISIKADASHKTEITLDPATFLPLKESSISLVDAAHPVVTQTRLFQDWERFQGLEFPRRITNFHNGKRVAEIRLLELKLDNRTKSEDLAVKPEDLKPQMSDCGSE